ncbi:alpha-glucuronidase [Segatella buccae]|uniref:alpha-glucuronidase n=1 Tax=Segatella buccae TaxID=28126 RepID=UPI0027BA3958|nr:alpha-glucuronidase [Segatella buccae]
MKKYLLCVLLSLCGVSLQANDGAGLWLGNEANDAKMRAKVIAPAGGATLSLAREEIAAHWQLGGPVTLVLDKGLNLGDGYRVQAACNSIGCTGSYSATISASTEAGLLYGAFELLRLQNTRAIDTGGIAPIAGYDGRNIDKTEQPAFSLRLLNHWDNLDGSIERGYAGKSIFWNCNLRPQTFGSRQPSSGVQRLIDYARANASVGINGAVLNNVNASPKMLTRPYLDSVRMIADILRPWGIKVYLSVNFGSPKALGATKTADPLDKRVVKWWQDKAKELYRLIPDFGGFLVKANSEGQPGPFDYGRTHADGANMLADALRSYGGIVMWRSFVYGARHKGEDRVKQAVSEFKELDGLFRPNVMLQSKNGPLDFQPREPYAPIFDNMKQTPQMVEFQITQEYLGQSKHLTYLATMWKEFFSFVSPSRLKGIAGVSNIGQDKTWCGHDFSQANWYAFGRLAWNPELSSEDIAREWLQQTFTTSTDFVDPMTEVMMTSREACVDYMMPLGLHHIFKFDHHYGPEPDGFKAEYPIEWCPVYYHKADTAGIGFDRSSHGTDAVGQYAEPYRSLYNDLRTCPEAYLLWFHHLPWNYPMRDGRTLWESLNAHYNRGVEATEGYLDTWQRMRPYVEETDHDSGQASGSRWSRVNELLKTQVENAREWRDVCLKYFHSFTRRPIR